MSDDGTIERRLNALLNSTEGIRAEIRSENIKRDQRIRWSRRLITAVFIVAIIAVAVGGWGIVVGNRASHDLHLNQTATQSARVAGCEQFNRQQSDNIAAQIRLSEDVVAALVSGSTDPATLQRAKLFNTAHDRLIRTAYPLRDCSAAGIAKYLGISSH